MHLNTTLPHGQRQIRLLFDQYIEMYSARDQRLFALFSDNFSGYTGSGDFLVKNRDQWIKTLQRDFAQVPGPIRLELLDLSLQDIGDTVVMATAFFHCHLPHGGELLAREVARLVLGFYLEDGSWKIVHSGLSMPYRRLQGSELYPLQRLQEDSLTLQAMVKERTQALHASEALYRQLTEDTPDVLWKVDSNLCLTYISPADERLRGFKADEVIGRSILEMFTDEGIATIQAAIQKRASASPTEHEATDFSIMEVQHRCKDGRLIWGEILSKPDRNAQGEIVGYHGITREITQRKLRQDQVYQLAFRDTLTQLANRRQLMEHLTQALLTGQRHHRCGALLFLDLDNFKALNDAHGHSAGDLLLIEVAHRLSACVRVLDTVARFGGDEFVVLLNELGSERSEATAHAAHIAETVRTRLAQPYVLKVTHTDQTEIQIEHHCTASIGVVVFNGQGASPSDMLNWADTAMYQAKTEGRNRVCFHTPESA